MDLSSLLLAKHCTRSKITKNSAIVLEKFDRQFTQRSLFEYHAILLTRETGAQFSILQGSTSLQVLF